MQCLLFEFYTEYIIPKFIPAPAAIGWPRIISMMTAPAAQISTPLKN